ncbi:hypothetical protein [Psychrobium sp. 1_MG-2023]|uniref:hypothetical protein n=1 Tax=Psychrobium sp. 1_MG-2023 TaxID=3062624 RepID=UPI000C320310|nr:hypothetical protein [Psychrobium sp. 1_MG-2023]MDP2559567.1 hypothetical protein [Psychrobium sp. 1_MG-2023]PKF59406.1 hypothetical protein CW748_01120 [Alteromonadales bacterium alter-6D02]
MTITLVTFFLLYIIYSVKDADFIAREFQSWLALLKHCFRESALLLGGATAVGLCDLLITAEDDLIFYALFGAAMAAVYSMSLIAKFSLQRYQLQTQ